MDKKNAVNLLNETFNNDFNNDKFFRFIKELFNEFSINQKDCTRYISKEYLEYMNSFLKIGDYKDNSSKEIEVLIVKLNKTSSRDRARTMQRNFIASWLGKTEKDAALVAFYGDDPKDWRFSFVKMEYNLIKDEKGKTKISKELTPAKRYSFLVGVNEPNHTCASQFTDLIIKEDKNPSIEEIEYAFSIEKVTKEFFDRYRDLFLKLKESLEKIVKRDKFVKEEFDNRGIQVTDFTKKLLGQIVFLYFLQKKGWLGVDINGNWGEGPKDFMRRLFGDKERGIKPLMQYKNFFNEILEPLFYDALATDRSADDHYYRLFKCKIPFLNGGLFEPINEYNWSKTDILLDNQIFEEIFKTFDRFNFTVKEDEPLEKEVAVDPEMLGKVFENLLEIKDRKSKGAFYTPREIVHYMCQQSLINYLETNTSISREDLEKFIQLGDFALDIIIREQEQIKKYGRSYVEDKFTIPKSVREKHKEIDKLLKEIKVIDPAVGSGAFPVGMMNEIVKARSILSIYFEENRKDYDLKREIIENCLYGVDIEPSAVEITKLRFWLSLIVDELDMKNIKPLPNLDHKIMCGNSLLEEFEGVKLFDEKLLGEVKKDNSFELKQINDEIARLYKEKGNIITGKSNGNVKEIGKEIKLLERKKKRLASDLTDTSRNMTLDEAAENRIKESQKKLSELKKLQKEYFNEQNRKTKKKLREDISKIEWELIEETLKEQNNEVAMQKLEQYKKNKAKPFFLWKLYFSDVFQRQNPGFDVVIANPPYLEARSPEFTESMKNDLQNFIKNEFSYESNLITKGADLLIYFYVKSLQLIRKDGFIAYISQNAWLDTDYGKKFQKFIVNNTNIKAIIDSDYKHFDTANINTVITFFIGNKLNLDRNNKVFFLKYHKDFDRVTYSFSKIGIDKQLKEDMSSKNFNQEYLFSSDYKWGFLLYSDKELLEILKILETKGKKIQDIPKVNVVCGQGLNLKKDYFMSKEDSKLIKKEALIPIMTSKEGAPYTLNQTYYNLIDKSKIGNTQKDILKDKKIKLFNKKDTGKIPPSLILPRGVSRHYCCINKIEAYSSSGVEIYLSANNRKDIDLVEKRLWVFLNSSLLWLLREISGRKNLGGGMLKAEATDLKQFNIYFELKDEDCQKLLKELDDKQTKKTVEEINSERHKQLDKIVFDFILLNQEQRDYIINKLKFVLNNRESKSLSR